MAYIRRHNILNEGVYFSKQWENQNITIKMHKTEVLHKYQET